MAPLTSRGGLAPISTASVVALASAACFVVYLTIAGTGDAAGLAIVWAFLALAAVSVIATARRARMERRRRALVGTVPTSSGEARAVRRAERWFRRRYLDADAPRTFSSVEEYREACDALARLERRDPALAQSGSFGVLKRPG
jgi:hypothetical protein